MDIVNMYRAADQCRAELFPGGRLFDVGQVPTPFGAMCK